MSDFVVPVPTVEQIREMIIEWDSWTEDDVFVSVGIFMAFIPRQVQYLVRHLDPLEEEYFGEGLRTRYIDNFSNESEVMIHIEDVPEFVKRHNEWIVKFS